MSGAARVLNKALALRTVPTINARTLSENHHVQVEMPLKPFQPWGLQLNRVSELVHLLIRSLTMAVFKLVDDSAKFMALAVICSRSQEGEPESSGISKIVKEVSTHLSEAPCLISFSRKTTT